MITTQEQTQPTLVVATEEAFAIPEWIEAMRELPAAGPEVDEVNVFKLLSGFPGLHDRLTNLNLRLETMDAAGVDMHVLGATSPGVQMFEPADATRLSQLFNDRMAEACRAHPDRFAALATVAPQDPIEAGREVERAVRELGLSGVLINSHTGGHYLDEPQFRPLLETIAGLGVPLYIHPRVPAPAMVTPYLTNHLQGASWGFAAETGLHALRLLTSGVFDELPDLKLVIGHMGEGIPYYFWRIDQMHTRVMRGGMVPKLEQAPSDYFRSNIWVTTSGVNWTPALRFCLDNIGIDRVMFAIDYPYEEMDETTQWLCGAGLSGDALQNVAWHTASEVFGLKL